ncbi:MAG: DNA helicase II [Endozoicomonadaceae bacterium]|nr:DNA helicase II [Endozoicomonadaceae bacterium]
MNIDFLNNKQQEAVTQPCTSSLVLAGAGSGKTSVLTYRIAWLVEHERIMPGSIIAVTFTNKAAAEIRGRLEKLLHTQANRMWIGTFHSIAHKLLRMHTAKAGLPENFQIFDSNDQLSLIKRLMKAENINTDSHPPRSVQGYINRKKEEGIRAELVAKEQSYKNEVMRNLYLLYEKQCQSLGVVDFPELLLRAYELWTNCPDILQHYHERFRFILVDEFQDTNRLQYKWLRKLAGNDNCVMAVGDDDQSIYGWRGACVQNIRQFTEDFSAVKIIRLEQNYRSTATILKAANAIIEHNNDRFDKTLWTDSDQGEPVSLFEALNERDEAQFITDIITREYKRDKQYSNFAILYRSNAQSRVLEEALMQSGIPYHVYGGQRFFDRAEIKDVLAYLRLIYQPGDDAAFERIINLPPRGIGNKTLQIIRDTANANRSDLWQATEQLLATKALTPRASGALTSFIDLIIQWRKLLTSTTFKLENLVNSVIKNSGLIDFYCQDKSEKSRNRVENLKELITACREFKPIDNVAADDEANRHPLEYFLIYSALESDNNKEKQNTDCVQMMTIHAAKGLEFATVFLCGMEEGLFPHQMSLHENNLNEERRLCYVGITRAQKKLYLIYAGTRSSYLGTQQQLPSRFISEIPQELICPVHSAKQTFGTPVTASRRQSATTFQKSSKSNVHGLKVKQRVQHKHFGTGYIMSIENTDKKDAVVQVRFKEGVKRLSIKHANLIPL